MKTQTNVPIEIELPKEFSEEFVTVSSKEKTFKLPVFQKANGRRYVRFSSPVEGRFECDNNGKTQTIDVSSYKGDNPLFLHGPIHVTKDKQLCHTDGEPFFYLSDTWWFGATKRMSHKDIDALLKLRVSQGFTAVQIVVGIPPEIKAFDLHAANEGGLPFHTDWSLNAAYFDEIDKRIEKIVRSGMVPVIFGGWGHHVDWMGVDHVKALWSQIIARYSSYPVIFSLAGEVDVFLVPQGINPQQAEAVKKKTLKYLEKLPRPIFDLVRNTKRLGSRLLYQRHEKQLLEKRIEKWSEVGQFVSQADSYNRIITAHPQRQKTVFDLFHNPSWLSLNAIQSGHSVESLLFMSRAISDGKKPIINLEPWYEGIAENFDAYFQRVAFWACVLSGASGQGYGAHGIWQFAKKDNFMRHWGVSDSTTALSFQGATHIGLAKKFLDIKKLSLFTPVSVVLSTGPKQLFSPISGTSGTLTFLYIPDQYLYQSLTFEKAYAKKLITVFEPSSMRKLKTMQLSGQNVTLPIDIGSPDILLVLE